jgi:hypothetical protein
MTDEKEISATATERPARRRRRRKKEYTDATYGARLPHEDARIADEYARQHSLDRADVVRLAMKQFAYRQQMRYQPKSEIAEVREQVFREHFAPVSQQLDSLSAALHDLPQALLELHAGRLFRSDNGNVEDGELHPPGDGEKDELARLIEAELRSQRRVLERAHFASVLTLRLVTNYLVEPQLRRIDASDAATMEPHLRAASEGNEAWGAVLSVVMKLTGERVMAERGFVPPAHASGTSDATKGETGNGAHTSASALSDADIGAVL